LRYESFSTQKQFASATATARRLLDESSYPLGSFSPDLYNTARDVLDEFLKWRDATDTEAVHASLDLLERLVKEMAFVKDDTPSTWLSNPRYFNPLFNRWKEAALQGERVISARDLVKKLQAMSTLLPSFRYDIATINMIFLVMIKQAHPSKAPFVAESLIEFIKTETTLMHNLDLTPNIYCYNMILNAWAQSKLPEASQRMDAIVDEIRSQKLALNSVSYNILLRFLGETGEIDKVEAILGTLKHDSVKPNLTSWAAALYCYTKVGQIQKAEEILQHMIDECRPDNINDENAIGQSVQYIMMAYRLVVSTYSATYVRKAQALGSAEVLFRKLMRSGILNAQAYGEYKVSRAIPI
jgi:pentatricopeptide repeat protein